MQDTNSIPESQTDSNPQEIPTPTSQEILAAPDGEWEALCELAEANVEFYRAWRKSQAQPAPTKPRKRSRRRSRPSTSTRNWSAASVLTAKVGDVMAEALDRVNEEEEPLSETRSIIVNAGDEILVIEVAV